MNTNEFNLEKGFDASIKYDWLVGEISWQRHKHKAISNHFWRN